MKSYRFSILDNKHLYKKMLESNPKFPDNAYFEGYFQTLACIQSPDLLRSDFTLKKPLNQNNETLKNKILNTENAVFLHIRRGDYLAAINSKFIKLESQYYNQALKILKEKLNNIHIYIFSNDIAWCKQNFLQSLDSAIIEGMTFEFVENNDEGNAIEEMELMRSCKHAIIANSTFSFWAAYLLENPNKIVIAPNKFFYTSSVERMQTLYPKEWIMIDV